MDVSQILLADEGLFDVSVSRQASVALDSAPDAATALTSFFQNNIIESKRCGGSTGCARTTTRSRT
jgi:hypothetical protein